MKEYSSMKQVCIQDIAKEAIRFVVQLNPLEPKDNKYILLGICIYLHFRK